jgi:hypothetical protein
MKNDHAFLQQYTDLIAFTLECFDRVVCKGHLQPLNYVKGMCQFVDQTLRIKRMDFMPWAEKQSQRIVAHAEQLAQEAQCPYEFLRGKQRKDDIATSYLRTRRLTEGLVCVLRCLEHCPSYRLVKGNGRPTFAPACPPALVFYFYYLDADLGLIHIRVPTLFPWPIQIAVNGHDYLAQQMLREKMAFEQHDNAFVALDHPDKAQALARGFLDALTPTRLRALALRVLPPLHDVLASKAHYWVIDQAEFATDLVFRDPQALAELYGRLVDHATLHFKAPDILGFLGRTLCAQFNGEVLTDCKKDRQHGTRVKHRMKANWLKMYDKHGRMLRIETVVNNPREFKVRRQCLRHGQQVMAHVPMAKGLSNLYRYQEVSQAANARYLAALAAVQPVPQVLQQAAADLERLGQSVRQQDRPYAAFNPARPADLRLFEALCLGHYLLNGFRNADVRSSLFPGSAHDPDQRRRDSAKVGRLLKRLHVRHLLLKVPHTRRWHLSPRGRLLFTELLHAHRLFTHPASLPLAA